MPISTSPRPSTPTDAGLALWSLPMSALLLAQFFSALADNALFVAVIALAKSREESQAFVPLLQASFVLPYILLAPLVGPFADALPKGRVMFIANGIKFTGAGLIAMGAHPLFAYALVGIGAAAYSPAKYGILTQLFSPQKLVKANGLLEGSTIVAILSGVLLGGWLADHFLHWAFFIIFGLYTVAALSNLLIPKLPPEHRLTQLRLCALLKDFGSALRSLFIQADTRFSLLGSSVFWGSGTTLRLLLFAWVPVALGLADNQTPATLMGAVSIGIALGAVLAGRFVSLPTINRALIGGLLLGPTLFAFALVTHLHVAVALLILVGACGGWFVVPLNALLQARGHASVGSGHALAVQNFCENLAMLLCVAIYSLAIKGGVPVVAAALGFGTLITLSLLWLTMLRFRTKHT